MMLLIVICYIANSTNYLNTTTKMNETYIFNEKSNINVYGIQNLLSIPNSAYLNDDQQYTIVENYDSLKKELSKNSIQKFYLITNEEIEKDNFNLTYITNTLNNYNMMEHTNLSSIYYGNFMITEFIKK